MRAPWRNAGEQSVGVALAADRLVARLPRRGRARGAADAGELWVHRLGTGSDTSEPWPDLAAALSELREALGGGRRRLSVALMPPLAQMRRVELAGLNEREATRIVSRDPSRFLLVGARPVAVTCEGTKWRHTSPFTIMVVPQPVLEAVGGAARRSGWSLGGVVAAQRAWAAAAGAVHEPRDIILWLDTHLEILRVANGIAIALRRAAIPVGDVDPSALPALLAGRGIDVRADARVISSLDEAAALAASFAPRTSGSVLLPDAEREIVRHNRRRATIARVAAVAALAAATALLDLWGVARDRSQIAAERARITRSVGQALAVRESIAVRQERLEAVRAIGTGASRWSELLEDLAEGLPPDAFLVSLDAGGDSLRLEGASGRAAAVFDALTALPGVRSIRPEGAIRQEVRGGDAVSEHFVLAALLARADSSAATERPAPNGHGGGAPGRQP
jgi:hypothetical protein